MIWRIAFTLAPAAILIAAGLFLAGCAAVRTAAEMTIDCALQPSECN